MKHAKTFANFVKELHPPNTVDIFIPVTSIPQIRVSTKKGFLFQTRAVQFEANNDAYEVVHLTITPGAVYSQHDASVDLLNTAFVAVSPASSAVPEEFLMKTNSLFATLHKSILFVLSASMSTRIFHQIQNSSKFAASAERITLHFDTRMINAIFESSVTRNHTLQSLHRTGRCPISPRKANVPSSPRSKTRCQILKH